MVILPVIKFWSYLTRSNVNYGEAAQEAVFCLKMKKIDGNSPIRWQFLTMIVLNRSMNRSL